MKIAYIVNHQIWKNDGVTKKIAAQISTWKEFGHDVKIFCFTRKVGDSILNARQYELKGAIVNRLLRDREFLEDVADFNPDMVYLRYDVWSRNLSSIMDKYPTVLELNTLDVKEFKVLVEKERSFKSVLRFYAYVMLRSRIFSKAAGCVSVTHEIANHDSVSRYALPTVVVPNGLNINVFPVVQRMSSPDDPIALFFIATPGQPWHGVDYIVEMAKKLPEYEFHIVGISGGEALPNIFWHGYLEQSEYLNILAKCNICIGTMAIFRNEMKEACPLKVREYLAYGYPVIAGYKDTAFFGGRRPEFFLEIDLEEGGVNEEILSKVKGFSEMQKSRVVSHDEIDFIDAKNLEFKRLSFFREIQSLREK